MLPQRLHDLSKLHILDRNVQSKPRACNHVASMQDFFNIHLQYQHCHFQPCVGNDQLQLNVVNKEMHQTFHYTIQKLTILNNYSKV